MENTWDIDENITVKQWAFQFSRNAYEFNLILFEMILIKMKHIHGRITSILAYVNDSYSTLRINSMFRFPQK